MLTRAVIVGASTYRQKEIFSPLRGAARDAIWFERFLRSKDVPDASVTCLIGDLATKDAILTAIRRVPDPPMPHALILFFSGHGGILQLSDNHDECVLFCNDTSIRSRLASSISITELLEAVSRSDGADEVYIFLDACNLTLASLAQQLRILANRARAARVFCCIIANDGGTSVEGFASPMGEFSSVLLASLQHVNEMSNPSVAALSLEVARRSARTGVTSPASVLLGDLRRWPFRSEPHVSEPTSTTTEVFRSNLVAKALELLRSYDGARVCIRGASGTGKSVVLRQVAQILGRCPIASFAREDTSLSPETVGQRIVEAIIGIMTEPEPEPELTVAQTLGTAVRAFVTGNPHAVIAIDGGENLADPVWSTILDVLDVHGVDLITTRHDAGLPTTGTQDIEIGPMSIDELARLPGVVGSHLSQNSIVRAYARSGGFPLPFLTEVAGNWTHATPDDLLRTEQILRTSGGYCNAPLFCAFTGVEKESLDRLQAIGLLTQSNDLFRLHDSAGQPVVSAGRDEMAAVVASYWEAEQVGKSSLAASLKIIELCLNPTLRFGNGVISKAIRITEGRVTSSSLMNAALAAAESGDDSALIEAIDVLSRRGESQLLMNLLALTERGKADAVSRVDSRVSLAKARAAWWAGDYKTCRDHAVQILASDPQNCRAALLELAIADFFEGNWSAAQPVLERLAVPGSGGLREIGWAQLILGTTLGIRGLSGERGRTLLRSSAELLRAANDLAGVAIARGNCGEVSWKSGDFEVSEQELKEGLEIADSLGMIINAVESQRNLVQLYLRWSGPDDLRITGLEKRLGRLLIEDIGRMEMMQVANTVATLNLYRRDLPTAERWLETARPLTAGNDEYDIYTRANDGLLLALTGQGGAREKIVAAADLCQSGSNRLALIQVRQDVVFCLGQAQTRLASELVDIIDQRMKRIAP